MIEKQEIKSLVYNKHGIKLADDDPVLSFLLVHDLLIERYQESFEQTNELLVERIEKITHDYGYDLGLHEKTIKQEIETYANKLIQTVATEVSEQIGHRFSEHEEKLHVLEERMISEKQVSQMFVWISGALVIANLVILGIGKFAFI